MPKGFSTFATHTALQAPPAAIRPEIAAASLDANGQTDLSTLDPETVASRYLKNAIASDEMPEFAAAEVNGQDSEFRSLGVETILLTNTRTVKYRQNYSRIPVYGSLVTVELDQNNELISINSALGNPADVDPVATVSPARALQVARRLSGDKRRKNKESPDDTPRLYFYYDQKIARWRLVYIIEDVSKRTKRSEAGLDDAALPEVVDYVIDAHSAELVDELPRTATAQAQPLQEQAQDGLGRLRSIAVEADPNGQLRLIDRQHSVQTHDFAFRDASFSSKKLPGDLVVRTRQRSWPPEAVSAHANAVAVVEFLKTDLMRDGLDNRGGLVISSINCTYDNLGGGKIWKNAAWWKGQMIYGQRDK